MFQLITIIHNLNTLCSHLQLVSSSFNKHVLIKPIGIFGDVLEASSF